MPDLSLSLENARALRAQGRHGDAARLLRSVLPAAPGNAELLHELGNALRASGKAAEALPHLAEAARLHPENPVFWLNLGVAHLEAERFEAALEAFRHALELAPDFPEAHNVTACALLALGASSEAAAHLQVALRLRPEYAAAHDNLGRCLRAQGKMEEALDSFEKALEYQPSQQTHSNALLALNYLPDRSPAEIRDRHLNWAARHAHGLPRPADTATGRPAHDRLRLGYVSGDLCNHSVAFFLAPVLANHDRSRFEVSCYSNGLLSDATTARLRSLSEHWRDISRLDDDSAARLIREDGIDILIDLSGHSARNRLLVFARRPAPLQLTWLGYPATTGMDSIDFRITDARCLPSGDDALQGSEKLLRLPDVFSCYEPPPDAPPTDLVRAENRGQPPVFCSFNNLAKLSEPTLALWARLLASLPGTSLLLKSPGADDPAARSRILNAFTAGGVSENRIHFHGRPLPLHAHLSLYRECHVALDPFPYNGTTTTCEALLMGVPVVTLAGNTHVSRVGVSLLSAVGLGNLVASSPDEYLALAARLAMDEPRLSDLRTTLRQRLLASPLCDAAGFTRKFEDVLSGLHLQSA